MSTVNERFRDVRKSQKFSQQQFADELGISRAHISNIENGNDKPSSSLIKLICYKYYIDENWLLTGAGSQLPSFNIETDEGALTKYNTMRVSFEQLLRKRTGKDLENTVEAFSYFIGILSANKLEGEECSEYLQLIYNWVDYYERMQHSISTVETILRKKSEDRHWLDFLQTWNNQLLQGQNQFAEAMNVYLQKYGDNRKIGTE